ncbi:hypothetical protein EV13_0694 [Prochlorococcus sp. MIT 0702]|nr:hypothetical protein EV12_0344 [Prochlorococcus sp. MIT 0701]KGG29890.1 hypothetical protein EV13_0694 [Prochlorococcus sp. MIT 0702]KGG34150.1 hypothetical protein EV14_1497 [Prochlorococcus sp. MIT 0703]
MLPEPNKPAAQPPADSLEGLLDHGQTEAMVLQGGVDRRKG